jgi:phage tail sheath protein FI
MPEYLAPGVYIEEIERGPKPIEGVATSTAAFLGETERGPTKPRLVTSYNDYLRLFGNVFDPNKYLPYSIKAFFDNGGKRCYIARVTGANSVSATTTINGYKVTAVGPGAWANRIYVRLAPGSTQRAGKSVGFKLGVYYWDKALDQAPTFNERGDVISNVLPLMVEVFDDISLEEKNPNFYEKRINNGNSALIELVVAPGSALPDSAVAQPLEDGEDGDSPTVVQFEGDAPSANERTGLAALKLDPYRDVAIVYAPAVEDDIVKAIVTHCENNRYRFAVIDSKNSVANVSSLDPRNDNDTKYGAFYYPWIVASDPLTGARKTLPPGGYVCGIYARSDNTRGVFKAPANETVAGALDLEFDIDHGTQEVLNPRGVNVIRRFPGRGIRVWGARTLSSDPLWRYVSVRRLFIFIEASIYNSTQWVVFEPNDARLWARVKQTLTLFLRTQWREGALFGLKEEEAFTVAVGRDTMTEDDILNGRLIIEVGIAPVRPAEFVIFRVFQKTQEAKS